MANPSAQPHLVFTGGGTLGPVTPLLAVARAAQAREPGTAVSWIGTEAGPERRLVEEAGFAFHAIPSGKLRRYLAWQNVADAFRTLRGFFAARALLRRIGADAVVTAGGFVAVPVCWAAKTLGIPVHVHQQDAIPGLANRLSLPTATSLSVTLEKSLKDFAGRNPAWTGNPVRAEILSGTRERGTKTFGLEASVPTLLVLGGGTGAAGLNALVRGALPQLTANAQVIHLAGKGKTDASVAHPRYHQYELLTADMPDAYAAADLVICRAGMGTLTELAALGKPAIIVPMPASHQEANAAAYAAASGAPVVDERDTAPEAFASLVLSLLADKQRLAAVSNGMRAAHREHADDAIAATVLTAAKEHIARK